MAFIRRNGWLIFLCLILLGIATVSLKPAFFLMGFDNYSAYFNQKDVIWRTIFSAWRNHWGLGVPADSEIVDLPRQLIYAVLNLFLPLQLVDQVYILLTLIFGGVGMFFLAKLLYETYIFPHTKREWGSAFGFISAFFYIFNLNTLATYFFIIVTYNNRFFALPWLVYILFWILIKRKMSFFRYLGFILILLVASGSYITGTILITTLMTLGLAGLFFLTRKNLKHVIYFFLVFFTINSFWLTPFFNYTREKSGIIRHAPTFIDANELQLNQPVRVYDIREQLILRPNFFDSVVTGAGNEMYPWHPLADLYDTPLYTGILFIFPVLYILGSLLLLVRFKSYTKLLWIPFVIGIFLFLSLKEYSPLGFLYHFFDRYIPYFGVLFRFGDTKFHPYIAFAGSLAAAFIMLQMLRIVRSVRFQKEVLGSILTVLVVLHVFVFRWYFTGQLIGHFLYSKIPEPYFEIAEIINADQEENRVLHVPLEKHGYWKSYSWGYIGSSFFHYLINKPLIDRTFEPASMENAYLHEQIYKLNSNMQSASTGGNPSEKIFELYNLLSTAGVEYVLYDGTVGAEQSSRGLVYWGDYNSPDVLTALGLLEDRGLIEVVKTYQIDPNMYREDYATFSYPPRKDRATGNNSQTITLYRLVQTSPRIDFIQSLTQVDSEFDTILNSSHLTDEHIRQQDGVEGRLYPFANLSQDIEFGDGEITLKPQTVLKPGKTYTLTMYRDTTQQIDQRMVKATIQANQEGYLLKFYHVAAPRIGTVSFEMPIGELRIDPESTSEAAWKIAVDGYVFTPPKTIDETEQLVGYLMTNDADMQVQILTRAYVSAVDPGVFSFTENPNCFNDQLKDYSFSAKKQAEGITITAQNGSACFWRGIEDVLQESPENTQYFEVSMTLSGSQESLDEKYGYVPDRIAKPGLFEFVSSLDKPHLLRVCVKEAAIDECLNKQEIHTIGDRQTITLPLSRTVRETQEMVMLISLMNNSYQKQQVDIHSMQLDIYTEAESHVVAYVPTAELEASFVIEGTDETPITLTIPHAESRYSSFQEGKDAGYYVSTGPCEEEKGYRTFRKLDDSWLNYQSQCHNQLFIRRPFSSNNFYLVGVEYNLYAGKYPKFILDDGLYEYKDEYVSLYQGYPDIEVFKKFNLPDWFDRRDYQKDFRELAMVSSYTWVPAEPHLLDTKQKQFTFHQDSLNEAGYVLQSMTVAQLPTAWQYLVVEPESIYEDFSLPESHSIRRILPSLWRSEVETNTLDQNMLLLFREGYDRQWIVSDSILGAIFGHDISQSQGRCDGYANCFELSSDLFEHTRTKALYIYYWPQTLAFIGWIMTLAAIGGGWIFIKKLHKSD